MLQSLKSIRRVITNYFQKSGGGPIINKAGDGVAVHVGIVGVAVHVGIVGVNYDSLVSMSTPVEFVIKLILWYEICNHESKILLH